jgi:hypothetical protein
MPLFNTGLIVDRTCEDRLDRERRGFTGQRGREWRRSLEKHVEVMGRTFGEMQINKARKESYTKLCMLRKTWGCQMQGKQIRSGLVSFTTLKGLR